MSQVYLVDLLRKPVLNFERDRDLPVVNNGTRAHLAIRDLLVTRLGIRVQRLD